MSPLWTSTNLAHELFGRILYPRLVRGLLGVEEMGSETPDAASIATDVDLAPIHNAVAALLPSQKVSTH